MDLNSYFQIADKAVNKASKYLLSEFGAIKKFTIKGPSDIQVKEDIKANKIYEKFLQKETPNVLLFTEEGRRQLSDGLVWVVDPIEGTSNYRVGIPFFATTICLIYKKKPILSIVCAPALNQKFHAIKGKGAFLNSKNINRSNQKDLENAMIAVARGRKQEDKIWHAKIIVSLLSKVRTSRNLGSAGLDMAYTAAGMLDVYLSRGLEAGGGIYDIFPGLLLLQESGCEVVNEKGKNFKLGDRLLLASNETLVKKVLDVI